MDVVNIKISKFGGLTKAKQARDLCMSLGVAMTLEDSWEATSSPRQSLTWRIVRRRSFSSRRRISTVTLPSVWPRGAAASAGANGGVDAPGLGIKPRAEVLGQPVVGGGMMASARQYWFSRCFRSLVGHVSTVVAIAAMYLPRRVIELSPGSHPGCAATLDDAHPGEGGPRRISTLKGNAVKDLAIWFRCILP